MSKSWKDSQYAVTAHDKLIDLNYSVLCELHDMFYLGASTGKRGLTLRGFCEEILLPRSNPCGAGHVRILQAHRGSQPFISIPFRDFRFLTDKPNLSRKESIEEALKYYHLDSEVLYVTYIKEDRNKDFWCLQTKESPFKKSTIELD